MLLLPVERCRLNFSAAPAEEALSGTVPNMLVHVSEDIVKKSVHCTPCCDAPRLDTRTDRRKMHHTVQACVIDRRTSSSVTVWFERQSIRSKTRHTLHGHNTETQSLIQRARRIFGDFDANVTFIGANTQCQSSYSRRCSSICWPSSGAAPKTCSRSRRTRFLEQTVSEQICCTLT